MVGPLVNYKADIFISSNSNLISLRNDCTLLQKRKDKVNKLATDRSFFLDLFLNAPKLIQSYLFLYSGNFIGQLPYVSGQQCSQCGRGQYCDRGLCSSMYIFGTDMVY